MIHENEIIMLMLGLGVLVFVLLNHVHLKRIPRFGVLFAAFCLLVCGWVMTVLEGFFPEDQFWSISANFLEHLFYAVSGICAGVWCWGSSGKTREAG